MSFRYRVIYKIYWNTIVNRLVQFAPSPFIRGINLSHKDWRAVLQQGFFVIRWIKKSYLISLNLMLSFVGCFHSESGDKTPQEKVPDRENKMAGWINSMAFKTTDCKAFVGSSSKFSYCTLCGWGCILKILLERSYLQWGVSWHF